MKSTFFVFPALSVALLGYTVLCDAQSKPAPVVVRLGYTTWNAAQEARQDNPLLNQLAEYLEDVSRYSRENSSAFLRPVDFDIVAGNYYQIYEWMKHGDIDGAIVSAFTATLLSAETQSVVELSPFYISSPSDRPFLTRLVPIVGSSAFRGPGQSPLAEYHRFLELILQQAEDPDIEQPELSQYRVRLVSYLSTTGFLTPILYAHEWLLGRLEEDATLGPHEEVCNAFWKRYFERVDFLHDRAMTGSEDATNFISIYFDYGTRSNFALESAAVNLGVTRWEPYAIPGFDEIPYDVIIFRRDFLSGILDPAFSSSSVDPWIPRKWARPLEDWTQISLGPVHDDQLRRFKVLHADFFAHTAMLKELGLRWYKDGKYDFSVEDTLEILRKDQQATGVARLALVLPGGGVKSAYQAALLNHLYEDRRIVNVHEPPPGDASLRHTSDQPLTVDTVVGTSGGAMVGAFTAFLHDGDGRSLRSLWVDDGGKSRVGSSDVFPFLDLLRWGSLLALAWILGVVAAVLPPAADADVHHRAGQHALSIMQRLFSKASILGIVAGTVLVLGPASLTMVKSEIGPSQIGIIEGMLFVLAIGLVHLGVSCAVHAPITISTKAKSFWPGAAALLAGACTMVAPAVYIWNSNAEPGRVRMLSILVCAGLVIAVVGLLTIVVSGRARTDLFGVVLYLKAAVFVVLFWGAAYLALTVLVVLGVASFLELTTTFWISVVAGGLGVALLLRVLQNRVSFLRDGYRFLARPTGVNHCIRIPPLLTGLVLGSVAFLYWILIVSPAVYGNQVAMNFFQERLQHWTAGPSSLTADLIVTGTAVDGIARNGSSDKIPAVDVYFHFMSKPEPREDRVGCYGVHLMEPNWVVVNKPDETTLTNAVFASGSPFPVFPPHRVTCQEDFEGYLIDGGYAHNVPLEAAVAVGARQVLLIRSQPETTSNSRAELRAVFPGPLARYVAKLLSFLFDRAQEVDRNLAHRLIVASLTPHPKGEAFPVLTDFRANIVERLVREASVDYRLRIGHVESWGTPLVVRRVINGQERGSY